jgi:histone H3/H4
MATSSELKPSDFEVPAACVNRIMKSVLSDNVMMTKEARAAIVRAVSIFIFYITHGANDFSRESKRQTIFPIDIINSLKYEKHFEGLSFLLTKYSYPGTWDLRSLRNL